jgi:hypothetical protein
MIYDLCFAWNWEYDADFAALLAAACQRRGISAYQVTPENLEATLQALHNGELRYRAYFDRASDGDERFLPLAEWTKAEGLLWLNPAHLAQRVWDKAYCHTSLAKAILNMPRTIIIPPHQIQPDLPPVDLTSLGSSFTIKPAHGGGGLGVVTGATTWEQVLATRQQFPTDQYLLQAYIIPAQLDGREAWFRMLHCAGHSYTNWWNTQTHIYTRVSVEEEQRYGLAPLRELTDAIASLCGLDLFTSEIALTLDGMFIIVDYVNDPIDMRIQSKAVDGVPDELAAEVAQRLVDHVALALGIPPPALPSAPVLLQPAANQSAGPGG